MWSDHVDFIEISPLVSGSFTQHLKFSGISHFTVQSISTSDAFKSVAWSCAGTGTAPREEIELGGHVVTLRPGEAGQTEGQPSRGDTTQDPADTRHS